MLTVADMLTTALTWHAAGYSVIPIKGDGSKQPALDSWRTYMDAQPDEAEVTSWGRSYSGMGVVCGGPMRLEMLEVEGYGLYTAPMVRALMDDNDLGPVWDRIVGGYLERSPRGGLHWFYRISDGPARGNTKLARRPHPDEPGKVQVLWETRGQGGQTVIAPSGGGTSRDGEWAVVRGSVTDIPTLTVDERDAVYAVLAMVDEMPAADPRPAPSPAGGMFTTTDDGLRPGDDYNQRTTWDDILTPHGWARVRKMGSGWTWRRPGKTDPGISATTGQAKDGVDRLYVFSTSTEFEDARPYSKFAAYALLEHRGDWSAAGRALYASGYGTRRERHTAPLGAPPANPSPDGTPDDQPTPATLFAATPTLEHIRSAARARMVSPWALLGAVLARIVAEVRPCVALPATVGSRASLNMYVGLVGPSGAAKTSAVAVADDLLMIGNPVAKVQGAGSGEGLLASYLRKNPDPDGAELYDLRENPHVCIVIDEIGFIGSIQGRSGSTLAPILRAGWSGSALETINADPTRRRIVPKMRYRLTAIAGIQPLAADVLFDDADTGTPQRWLWLPALDPDMPDEAPEWPGPLAWSAPSLIGWQHHGLVNIRLPEHVTDAIRAAHRARHRDPNADHLDGHLTLTRLKVAAALAILHGSYEVDDPTWELAGQVMDVSIAVRGQCQQAMGREATRRAEARGALEHARDLGRAEAVAETARRDAQRVWLQVQRHTGDDPGSSRAHAPEKGCSGRCVTLALTRRSAELKEDAVNLAVAMSWVTKDADGRLHLGVSQPAEVAP